MASFKKIGDTIVIRNPKIKTDERGRSVWVGDIESVELELLSTKRLRKLLDADDTARKEAHRVVRQKDQGVLARDNATGVFQVLDPKSLEKEVLEQTGYLKKLNPDDKKTDVKKQPELSLADTQVLKKMLKDKGVQSKVTDEDVSGKGYDPYNSG
ncbi:MAG: hypothetical protein AAF438_08810 [Pseudomonadota bacterium]